MLSNIVKPLTHDLVSEAAKLVLRQDDCDPAWEECDYAEEVYGDEYDVEAMDEEMEEEGELALKVGLPVALAAFVMNAYGVVMVSDVVTTNEDLEGVACALSILAGGPDPCTFGDDDAPMGAWQKGSTPVMVNTLTWLAMTPGMFLSNPMLTTVSLYASFANLITAGLYAMYYSSGSGSYDDCTADIVEAEYWCVSDDASYSGDLDPNQDIYEARAIASAVFTGLTAVIGFVFIKPVVDNHKLVAEMDAEMEEDELAEYDEEEAYGEEDPYGEETEEFW